MENTNITSLTELAFKFGPFFFAVLIMVFMSGRAYLNYKNSSGADEKKTNKGILISYTALGMALVLLSVLWWWNKNPELYVFTGKIKNLNQQEKVLSENLYMRSNWIGKLEGIDQIHSDEFLIVQGKPFKQNETFDIHFVKGSFSLETFSIPYEELPENSCYEIVFDTTQKKNVLKPSTRPVSPAQAENGFSFFNSAVAQENKMNRIILPNQKAEVKIANNKFIIDQYIRTLQNEYSDIGSKINAIDGLNTLTAQQLNEVLNTTTDKEEVALTLLDLTRHTDKELSYKAGMLAKNADVNSYVARKLVSTDKAQVTIAENIISRVDATRANEIFSAAGAISNTDLSRLQNKLVKEGCVKILKPTASPGGDRYYVKANWDPGNKEVVGCLSSLFNKELMSTRTLQQEQELMKKRKVRWVYWYSKEWALQIADKINACGGTASFGNP